MREALYPHLPDPILLLQGRVKFYYAQVLIIALNSS